MTEKKRNEQLPLNLSRLDTRPKRQETLRTLISSEGPTLDKAISGALGLMASSSPRETGQKDICPACKRSVDHGKLPIYINSSRFGGIDTAMPRLVACRVCKMPPNLKTRLTHIKYKPVVTHRAWKPPAPSNRMEPVGKLLTQHKLPMMPCPVPGCEMLVRRLKRHLRKKHRLSPILAEIRGEKGRDQGKSPSDDQSKTFLPNPKKPCPNCGRLLSQIALDVHVEGCRKNQLWIEHGLYGLALPFELLPPGVLEFRQFYKEQNNCSSSRDRFGVVYVWSRLAEIERLGGKMTYYGSKAWSGYCVYEFADTDRIVLESPIEGNATYVLSKDWKNMIHRHKSEIREEYTNNYVRVIHTGDYWLRRVDRALCRAPYSSRSMR